MNKVFQRMRENYVNERQKKSNLDPQSRQITKKRIYILGGVGVELKYVF